MRIICSCVIALLLAHGTCVADESDAGFRKRLQRQLIEAKPGDVVEIPAGTWKLIRPLSLAKSGVTLRGAGPDQTILSFKGQIQGGEGISIGAASNVTIEDLAIEDTRGDGLKANGCEDLTIRNVRVEWTRGPSERNGGYGLYPVMCERVLIESSAVSGASDAGIYVGQSQHVVVRNNRVEYNVVGIEIENTRYADVHDNEVTKNTGGILVINMPNLPVKLGRATRVYRNRIYENNTENFAPPGNVIARVPRGTGFMIIANDEVEFFDNLVENNESANAMIVSFAATGKPPNDRGYDPFPQHIAIHHNRFSGGGNRPDGRNMPALRLGKIGEKGRVPDILWDGVMPDGFKAGTMKICVHDNGDAQFANIDLRGRLERYSTDRSAHECMLPPLSPVSWEGLPAAGASE